MEKDLNRSVCITGIGLDISISTLKKNKGGTQLAIMKKNKRSVDRTIIMIPNLEIGGSPSKELIILDRKWNPERSADV